jgi:phosphoribosyl 1,2-cyclic phosphodiesterase
LARNFIKFLGTAGARFVMIKQLRASGGLWVSYQGTNLLIDPGPGSLIRCLQSKPALNPESLDGIILTHKHIDHANDANVMIEAMTGGGYKKRGVVVCPKDLIAEGVILPYAQVLPAQIIPMRPFTDYEIGHVRFTTSMQLVHPAETYGLKLTLDKKTIAILPDTRYFSGLEEFFKADIIIIAVVFLDPRPGVDHMSLRDARDLLGRIRPKQAFLTHFGLTMLQANPQKQARRLSKELGSTVVAARDGMTLSLDT